jgi:phosphate transport system substrate-binding protein
MTFRSHSAWMEVHAAKPSQPLQPTAAFGLNSKSDRTPAFHTKEETEVIAGPILAAWTLNATTKAYPSTRNQPTMKLLTRAARSFTAVAVSATMLAGTIAVAAPGVVSAAGPACPITVNEQGSTTVGPALVQAQAGFQGSQGCTLAIVQNGSSTGLNALLASIGGGSTVVNVAASSRPLKSSGDEPNKLYSWQIGGDAMVIAVKKSMPITQITMDQVKGIYNGTITNWSSIPGAGSGTIVPRSRIIGSGSRDDLLRLFGVTDALEQATITATGLGRLTTSADESDAACNNVNQIVYTSLANLLLDGPSGSDCLKALQLAAGSTSTYVAPSVTTVQNGTYPAPRQLFLALGKFSVIGSAATTDDSANVKAQDLVNYMLTSAGQTAVNQVGFVNQAIPASQPIPDFDVNLDGGVSVLDLGKITGKWGQTSACKGWIRADVNNDGGISVLDLGKVTGKWGGAGFQAP